MRGRKTLAPSRTASLRASESASDRTFMTQTHTVSFSVCRSRSE